MSFVVSEIECEGRIGSTVRQCQQIRATNEVIAIEIGETQSTCCTNTHDGFEGCGPCQGMLQFCLEFGAITGCVEGRVVVGMTRSVLGKARQGSEVGVLAGEEESIDGDLKA